MEEVNFKLNYQSKSHKIMIARKLCLNHKSQQATAIYARLDLDPVRQSVNTATAAMFEAAGLKEGAEVLSIKRGA